MHARFEGTQSREEAVSFPSRAREHAPTSTHPPTPWIQASGSCAAADLEAALQLLHLLFVAELRWDEGRLETVLSYVEEHVKNQNKDPQERLMGLINQVNTQVGYDGWPRHQLVR